MTIEAAHFTSKGGWVVDQQFIDQMGYAFLMAHGLGRPVADASMRVTVKGRDDCGWCRLEVLTRDWASPWGPGRFVIELWKDGERFFASNELGVGIAEWHWEDCGSVRLPDGEIEIRLHDMTGFDGRVAAIRFLGENKEHSIQIVESERECGCGCVRKEGVFDFVVVGGGYAGMCAAVSAARLGVKTALVQDRPVYGGNASSEIRVGPIGKMGLKPFPRNSDQGFELWELTKGDGSAMSAGVRPEPDDARIEAWLQAEKNLELFTFCRARDVSVEAVDEQKIITALAIEKLETGEKWILRAKQFCDATGDGWLAERARAEVRVEAERFEETRERFAKRSDGKATGQYGTTNYWLTRWTNHELPFPACPWALRVELEDSQYIENNTSLSGDRPYAAAWNWESGFDRDAVIEGEFIRDYNFRAAYGMWDYLKNRSPERANYAKAEMSWLGYIAGKRSARRIVGDYILTEHDLTQHRTYDDGVVTTTWYIDMHFPDPRNAARYPEGAFRSIAYDVHGVEKILPNIVGEFTRIEPYPIPLRCFYSKDVKNLWMAGKDISCTFVAMASVRVENTTAQMGTMVGRAVSLCVKNGWTPRELACAHFSELVKLLKNPGPEPMLAKIGRRLYQGRKTLAQDLKYRFRVVFHWIKRGIGLPYLKELTGEI